MARITVLRDNPMGAGRPTQLSLDSENMIPNDAGVSWRTPSGSVKIIPFAKIHEIEIHESE
jgi:hypothetical protein